MSIAETLKYIHSVKWQGVKPGLERTKELLSLMGNPEQSLKFVHIAGTNGKGSTAAIISSVLRAAGYRTGLYTSPYLERFNERMQVNGELISDHDLGHLTCGIRPLADSMLDSPTEFELITALAMRYFLNRKCDIVVLEVGMGGELDSTNVIGTPEVAVITSIGYDHVREIGPRLVDIARAKAGIIKNNSDVVIYGGEPEVEAVFGNAAQETGSRLIRADFSRIKSRQFSLDGIKLDITPYGEMFTPLAGAYQPKNVTVSLTALELLREKGYVISDDHIVSGLSSVKWPGRFEVLGRDPVFILDGAHNPPGILAAADSLRCHFGDKKVIFVVGVMADKDVDSMLSHIAPLAEAFIAVRPECFRAMGAKELAEKLSAYGVPVVTRDAVWDGVTEALAMAGKDDVICALGSLFFSADVRQAYNYYMGGNLK